MRNYEKYEKYKDSGIEWIGEVPESWNVEKIKNIADFISRGTTPDYNERGTYKVVNQATFSKGFFDESNIRFHKCKNKQIQKKELKQNDILLASTGGGVLGKSFFFDKNDNNYVADSHVTIIRDSKNRFNPKFLFYFFSINYNLIEGYLGQGSTNQTEIQRQWLRHLYIPFPQIKTQNKIVQYLDKKQKQAETFIKKQKKIIELLKEQKKAIINKAVTKGINKDVKLKDSGVEWIGKIPEDWEVRKLKFLCNLNYGNSLENTARKKGKIPVYGSNGIVGFHNKSITKAPCIIIGRKGSFGKINLSESPCFPIDTTYFVDRVKDNDIDLLWLYYALQVLQLDQISNDTGVPGLNRESAYQKLVPIPSLSEQRKLTKYIEKKLTLCRKMMQRTQKSIDLVYEYINSLIFQMISGACKR